MNLVYLFVVFLVTALLISIPLFPFCKFNKRLKTQHPDIWQAKGPFDFRTLVSHGAVMGEFVDFAKNAHRDPELSTKDPQLARLSLLCSQVADMAPKTFVAQIAYVAVFLYFVLFFTSIIMGFFK